MLLGGEELVEGLHAPQGRARGLQPVRRMRSAECTRHKVHAQSRPHHQRLAGKRQNHHAVAMRWGGDKPRAHIGCAWRQHICSASPQPLTLYILLMPPALRLLATFGNGHLGRLGLGAGGLSEKFPRILGTLVGYSAKQVSCGGAHTTVVTGVEHPPTHTCMHAC